tara:strand:+ start:264 stop:473 length:210 start_codon:yes stop_codon:yes gene_type:complete
MEDRISDPIVFNEAFNLFRCRTGIQGNSYKMEAIFLMLLKQLLEKRSLLSTRRAPGSPKIEEDDFTLKR